MRERRRTRIDQADKIRSRTHACQGVTRVIIFCVKFGILKAGRSGQFCAGGKAHDANLIRINVPVLRVSTDQTDRLKRIIHFVRLHIVAIFAQAIPQDD